MDHEHAFLKIRKHDGAPNIMMTVLNEESTTASASEQPILEESKRGGGCRGGRGGFMGRGGGWKQMVGKFYEKMGVPDEKLQQSNNNPWAFGNGEGRGPGGKGGHFKK